MNTTEAETAPPRPIRHHRRAQIIAALALVLVAAAVGLATLGLGGRHAGTAKANIPLRTVAVTRCTLIQSETSEGSPSYGSASPLPIQATGTITWMPKPGTIVHAGRALIKVDDRPVVLLHGNVPQYRTLHPPVITTSTVVSDPSPASSTAGKSTRPSTAQTALNAPTARTVTHVGPTMHGADVRELKRALKRLGYNGFDAGDNYTTTDAEVVKTWQSDLGEARSGVVGLGDVYYADGPTRVVPGSGVSVGQPMSTSALQSTARTRIVDATLPDTATWAKKGAHVSVDAGGRNVVGILASVAPASSSGADGGSNLSIEVHVADQAALAKGGQFLTLTHVSARRTGVLCVPSLALVALAEGGYGLQRTSGQASYVVVQTGLFAQGKVQVSGAGVHPGLQVDMPVGD